MIATRKTAQLLHEPIAPYFSDAYTSLISAAHGVSLGIVMYVVTSTLSVATVLDGAAMVALIFTVWHRYVIHVQYVAWRFGPIDTLIPIAVGVVEVATAFTIPRGLVPFMLGATLTTLIGVGAYANIVWRHRDAAVRELFQEHFAELHKSLGDEVCDEVMAFSYWSLRLIVIIAGLFGAVAAIRWFIGPAGEAIMTWVAFVVVFSVATAVAFFDLNWWLRRSRRETIGRYSW